jgi:hypothetical protein
MNQQLALKFSDIAPTVHKQAAPNIPLNTTITGLFNLDGNSFSLINLIFFLIGTVFLINILIAAYEFISGNGDPQKILKATNRLLNGFIGLAITLSSFGIVQLIASLIGIPRILF